MRKNVDMNDPDTGNIYNYSLKANINNPETDTNIKIEGKKPNFIVKLFDSNDKIDKSKINVKNKKA